MAWWPWRRSGDESVPAVPPAPPLAAAPRADQSGAWADLAPVQRVLPGPIAPVAPLDVFRSGLATSRNPSFLAPLAHAVDPSVGGLVDGIASTAEPRVHADGPPLPVPPRPSRPAPRVQRRAISWSSPDAVTQPSPVPEPDAVTEPSAATEPDVELEPLVSPAVPAPPVTAAERAPSAEGKSLGEVGPPAAPAFSAPAIPAAPSVGAPSVGAPSVGAPSVGSAVALPARTLAAVADPGPAPSEPPPLPVAELPVVARLAATPAAASVASAAAPTVAGLPVQRFAAGDRGTPDATGAPPAGGAGVVRGVPPRTEGAWPAMPELTVVPRGVDAHSARPVRVPTTVHPTSDAPTLGAGPLAVARPASAQPLLQRRAESESVSDPVQPVEFLPVGAVTAAPASPAAALQRVTDSRRPAPTSATGSSTPAPTRSPAAVLQRLADQSHSAEGPALPLRGLRPAQDSAPLPTAPLPAAPLPAAPLPAAPLPAAPLPTAPLLAWPSPALPSSSAPSSSAPSSPGRASVAPPVVLRQAASPAGPFRSTSFAEMFSPAPGAGAPVDAEVASVQRDAPEPPPEPAPEVTAEPAPSAPAAVAAAPAAAAAPGAPASDVEAMAERLYEPLAARLRAELWLDRERAGV